MTTQSAASAVSALPATSAARDWRLALAWMFGALLLRTGLAALVPLLPDETYYWEWSRRLEAGYFDHPPGIALLIAFGAKLLGNTHTGVRAGPALAALVTHAAAVTCAWQLAGRGAPGAAAAHRAAQLVTLLPIATLGLVMATPDAALFATAMIALLAVAGPWVASALALALFAPVVVWNAMNNWVSFRFQLGHGFTPSARGNPLSRELEMLGGQAGLASPILFGLLAVVVWRALRDGWRTRHSAAPTDRVTRRFALAMIALVPLVFFAVSAWRRAVEANWPAMIYPGAMMLLATSDWPAARGAWWRRGLWLAAMLLAVVTVQAWRPILPLAPRRDPIARAHGWTTLAAAVDRARRDPFLDGTVDQWIAADRYQDASELAFHLPDQPTVFALNLGGRTNQYDVWPNAFGQVRPGDGLVVAFDADAKGDSLAAVVGAWFDRMQQGERVSLQRNGGEITTRRLWLYRIARDFPRLRPGATP